MKNPILKHLLWVCQGCPLYFGVLGAVAATAVVSAATSAISAGQQEDAANKAQAAGDRLTQQQIDIASQARKDANAVQKPFYSTGVGAQNKLGYLTGVSDTVETQNDTSFNVFRQNVLSKLEQHIASRPTDKKELKKWKEKKASLEKMKKAGSQSSEYKTWASRQPSTTKQKLPITNEFGSLTKDFGVEDFRADPGYQFRVEQGNRAGTNKLASMGMSQSGSAVKEAIRFNQGEADQTYNDAFSRFNTNKLNKYNILSGVAASGQRAAEQISANENTYGANAGAAKQSQNQSTQENITAAGNARAAGTVGIGNAISSGISSYAGYAGQNAGQASIGGAANQRKGF